MISPARLFRRSSPARTPQAPGPAVSRRRWPKRLAILGLSFGLLLALVFFAGPPLLKSLLVTRASEELGRKVSVGEIHLNPLLLTLEVRDFEIQEPAGGKRFVAFRRLLVDLETESLYRRAPVLREVVLEQPYVNVVRLPGNRFNFTDLVEKFAKKDKDDSPARFSVNNIRITGGSADFDDQPARTRHQIRELDLAIPFVSNLPYLGEIFVQPALSAKINGAAFALKGRTKPFSAGHETAFDLSFNDLDLPHYLQYVPFELPYRIASARLDVNAALAFRQPEKAAPQLTLAGKVALRKLDVTSPEGEPMAAFERLEVHTAGIDVFGNTIPLRSVTLTGLAVNAVRRPDGSLNLQALAAAPGGAGDAPAGSDKPPTAAGPAASSTPAKPPRIVTVDKLQIEGTLTWDDRATTPAFRTTIHPVSLTVTGLSTAADAPPARLDLQASTDAAEMLKLGGTVAPASGQVDLDLGVSGIRLPRYAPYYGPAVLFDIVSGRLDLSGHVAASPRTAPLQASVTNLALSLDDLRLRRRDEKKDFAAIPSLRVIGASADLAARRAAVADVRITRPELQVRRLTDGSIDLARLTPPPSPGAAAAPSPPGPASAAGTPAAPWTFSLQRLLLDAGQARFIDEVPAGGAQTVLAPLRVEVSDLTLGTPGTAKLAIKARINGGAEATITGTVTPSPLAAKLKTRVTGLDLVPFLPYYNQFLNVTLGSAKLSVDGQVDVSTGRDGALAIGYEGNGGIGAFSTLDKAGAEDILRWESLFFDGVRFRSQPFALGIHSIALTNFRTRIQINEDGSLNILRALASPEAVPPSAASKGAAAAPTVSQAPPRPAKPAKAASAAPAPAAPAKTAAAPRAIRIDEVTLQGGTILFNDRIIKPNVTATMTQVTGRVAGLMSEPTSRASVDLRGRLASQAPLSITGQINPLAGDLFADLKISFRDIELPPLTPYAGKYAGYTIEKGKLSLDLSYLIDKRQIKAENRVFIDQFTFGQKVDSPDALKLPVGLAVSLLKDREGRINLDVPVSGSLDDPKFKLGRVIWQVIVNLLTKAVTAPFALLGSMFGGDGEQLSYLEFAPGSASPDAAGATKLEQLAKALTERQALSLEVSGHVDPAKDRQGLLQGALERKLKAQRYTELARAGSTPESVDAVSIDPADAERLLLKAYKAEKFAKPRNAIGLEKSLPREEMEKLMLANLTVTEDDLRQLALRRAQSVKDVLTAKGAVSSERIFLMEPKSLAATPRDKVAASRVEFVLR